MANIIYRRGTEGSRQLIVNGVDLSNDVYAGSVELVEVGEGCGAEVGLRFTIGVSHLTLDTNVDVEVTDHFAEVAQAVRSINEASDVTR